MRTQKEIERDIDALASQLLRFPSIKGLAGRHCTPTGLRSTKASSKSSGRAKKARAKR